jgi:hypothetical protein
MTGGLTVEVQVGDEIRRFPAHYEDMERFGKPGDMRLVLTPHANDGDWIFQFTMDGKWLGARVTK